MGQISLARLVAERARNIGLLRSSSQIVWWAHVGTWCGKQEYKIVGSMNAISVCLKCRTSREHQDSVFVQQSIIRSCLHKCSTGSKSEKCLYPGILKRILFCKTKQTDRYCILISICSPCRWNKAKNRLQTQIFQKLVSLGFITALVEFGCNGHSTGLVHLAEYILELISQKPLSKRLIYMFGEGKWPF